MTIRRFLSPIVAILLLAALNASAQPSEAGNHHPMHGTPDHEPSMHQGMGSGMGRGPVGLLTTRDAQSGIDMRIAMNLIHQNRKIRRTVTRLPDGIKTVTESDDPRIAQDIKAHVASMSGRLESGKEFNIFSTTLPVIFENAKQIQSTVEYTDQGAVVTRRSQDPKVVAALQAHADEVTELVKEGPVAFHRGLDTRMSMGPGGPRGRHNPVSPGSSSNRGY
jgi:hypothetical protein